MSKIRIKTINWIFALLMFATLVLGGVWYHFVSLQWQNDDPPIGYVVGFLVLCYFGFFMLVGEAVLWRNVIYFVSSPQNCAIEKLTRVLLTFVSIVELLAAVYALCVIESSKNFDFLALSMLGFSVIQIVCQSVIWGAKWVACHKQTAKE